MGVGLVGLLRGGKFFRSLVKVFGCGFDYMGWRDHP